MDMSIKQYHTQKQNRSIKITRIRFDFNIHMYKIHTGQCITKHLIKHVEQYAVLL